MTQASTTAAHLDTVTISAVDSMQPVLDLSNVLSKRAPRNKPEQGSVRGGKIAFGTRVPLRTRVGASRGPAKWAM